MKTQLMIAAALATALAMPHGAALAQTSEATPEAAAAGITGDNPTNPTLATVNGLEVTAADVAFAMETLAEALQRVPPENRASVALDLMIDMHLIADAAQEAGLDSDPQFQQRVDAYRMQTLRDVYMATLVEREVSDEAVRARYDEEVAKLAPREEVSARHILVEDEAAATALIAELDEGADFAALAEEHSIDPGSAANGGSLGWFGPGQMVPPFEEAAFALAPGERTSAPVQSRFGYHIIQLDERRTAEPPTFEDVSPQIRQMMIRDVFVREIETLKADAEISYATDPQTAGEAEADAEPAPQAAPEAAEEADEAPSAQ